MTTKMTDSDIMVMLRNTALMLEEIAKTTGQDIRMSVCADGFIRAEIGDYEFVVIDSPKCGHYEAYRHYRPGYGADAWTKISPQQVRFGQPPIGSTGKR